MKAIVLIGNETVADAIRRHRARSGQPFPYGICGQANCPHQTVAEVMGLPWPDQPEETYTGRHRSEKNTANAATPA